MARAADVSPSTVRFYVRAKLLKPKRASNGYMKFGASDLKRLVFIRRALKLGYTLADVKAIVRDAEKGQSPCPRVRQIVVQRMDENERRLAEMIALQARLRKAARLWERMPDQPPTGNTICHLIESMEDS